MDMVKIRISRRLLVKISNVEFQAHLSNDLGADTKSVMDGRTRMTSTLSVFFFTSYRWPNMYNEHWAFLRNDKNCF
jgi:hypothetical protein